MITSPASEIWGTGRARGLYSRGPRSVGRGCPARDRLGGRTGHAIDRSVPGLGRVQPIGFVVKWTRNFLGRSSRNQNSRGRSCGAQARAAGCRVVCLSAARRASFSASMSLQRALPAFRCSGDGRPGAALGEGPVRAARRSPGGARPVGGRYGQRRSSCHRGGATRRVRRRSRLRASRRSRERTRLYRRPRVRPASRSRRTRRAPGRRDGERADPVPTWASLVGVLLDVRRWHRGRRSGSAA